MRLMFLQNMYERVFACVKGIVILTRTSQTCRAHADVRYVGTAGEYTFYNCSLGMKISKCCQLRVYFKQEQGKVKLRTTCPTYCIGTDKEAQGWNFIIKLQCFSFVAFDQLLLRCSSGLKITNLTMTPRRTQLISSLCVFSPIC